MFMKKNLITKKGNSLVVELWSSKPSVQVRFLFTLFAFIKGVDANWVGVEL